jgi:hypothetical protein
LELHTIFKPGKTDLILESVGLVAGAGDPYNQEESASNHSGKEDKYKPVIKYSSEIEDSNGYDEHQDYGILGSTWVRSNKDLDDIVETYVTNKMSQKRIMLIREELDRLLASDLNECPWGEEDMSDGAFDCKVGEIEYGVNHKTKEFQEFKYDRIKYSAQSDHSRYPRYKKLALLMGLYRHLH